MPPARSFLGERLRAARTRAGLSQSDIQHVTGIPKTTLSRYENDRIRPSIENLLRIASALGVTPGDLLAGDDTPDSRFMTVLRERGVRFRSTAEAERVAGQVANALVGPAERAAGESTGGA